MIHLLLSLSHFLHIIGALTWLGGILMLLLVILPSSKAAFEATPMAGKLMKEITHRFTPLANISIFVLIGTGIIIFYYDKNRTPFLDQKNLWNILIFIKFLLVISMVSIHFYRGLILNKKIVKLSVEVNETRTAGLKKFSSDLVKTNFVIGFIVLMLTAIAISL